MKDTQFAKVVVFTCSLVPLTMMALDFSQGNVGPDPRSYAMNTTGITALIFLLLSLSVTPLRKITGKNYWSLFRRMLGLFAFFYASVHVFGYLLMDRHWDFGSVITDVFNRRFVFFGMGAFLLMVPLAATSTVWSIKKLGAKRWKRLHQLAYLSAAAAAIHFCLFPKVLWWHSLPARFAAVLAVLLGFRLAVAGWGWWVARKAGRGGAVRNAS